MGYIQNTSECRQMVRQMNQTAVQGLVPSIELHETLMLVTGFGVFAALVATLFSCIRKRIHKDKNVLDTAFDAGGRVSVGLTATTIVSQWTWAATLLYSCTVASKYGISGPFWYAAGATIQILLFAMVSVQLRIRAPGAKTFLQVIRARFGARTHKVFVFYALLTNVFVTVNSMLGGAAVLSGLTKDMGVEYATMLMAAVIGTYTFIGGLGATFYVSFFNTALICCLMLVFIVRVYDDADNDDNPLGSIDKVYRFLTCGQGPSGNKDNSFLTMLSDSGLMFGLITISSGFGTSYVDQSYWQSSVAAKPRQGVLGFLAGGLVWFAIPFALATTMGLAYIALSARQDTPLLSEEEINLGLVLPVVSQRLFGRTGEMMMVVMVLMAAVSTGSAEVLAVTSILVYDIYQLYLKPYRLVLDANSCILCGKGRGRLANLRDKCTCESMKVCRYCKEDDRERENCQRAVKSPYECRTHGSFRAYTDCLSSLKNWCLLWTTMAIVPLTILLHTLQVLRNALATSVQSVIYKRTYCTLKEDNGVTIHRVNMNIRTATGGILFLVTLRVTRSIGASIAEPSNESQVAASPVYYSSIFTCGSEVYPNRTFSALFPPSDSNLPINNITLYKELQKEDMAAFCASPDLSRYTSCVQTRLDQPGHMYDAFAKALVNVTAFHNVFELYCNNTDLIQEQLECTLTEETAHPCIGGGIYGMIGQTSSFLRNPMLNLCKGMELALKCRFDNLSNCNSDYAYIMRSVYTQLFKCF